uniref:Zinc knuckle CX2CX4HX4C n=1 Tax=Tanacetum cinerariifolium TaxID=118510 RepID=A0A6L2KIQ6_TANCI|nr:hypothetical protein [Tanacetum cinerariifolium]
MKPGFLDSGGRAKRRKKDDAKDSQLAVDVAIHIENPTACPNTKPDTPTNGLYGVTSLTTTSKLSTASTNSNATRHSSSHNGSNTGEHVMNEAPSSYAKKLSPTSLTKANLRKLEANVPNDADYGVWLPLASIHEYPDDVRLVYEFHVSRIMRRSSYARVLIKTNACNDFSNNLVMDVPNLEGNGYTKETIRTEYVWVPLSCGTCLIYGHSLDDCPNAAPKRVVNGIAKGMGQTSGAGDEGFIEVKKKRKPGGNNGGNKNFKPVLVKPKTCYQPKAKQSTEGTSNSLNTTHFVDMNKDLISCYNKESPRN